MAAAAQPPRLTPQISLDGESTGGAAAGATRGAPLPIGAALSRVPATRVKCGRGSDSPRQRRVDRTARSAISAIFLPSRDSSIFRRAREAVRTAWRVVSTRPKQPATVARAGQGVTECAGSRRWRPLYNRHRRSAGNQGPPRMASRAAADHLARAAAEPLAALADVAPQHVWLRPAGLMSGAPAAAAIAAGLALPLAGAGLAFPVVEILGRRPDDGIAAACTPMAALRQWSARGAAGLAERIDRQLERLAAPRPDWAGLSLARPLVMGIVNVTPDSFSDGGDFLAADQAIRHGRALIDEGADILDVGGESTRPGATPVPPEEELRRVEPVVRALAAAGAVVSIDTRHAQVMAAALAAGARIVNDVSALAGEPDSLRVAARAQAPVVLMHMPGDPRTMQDNPSYRLASLDVLEHLAGRVEACV